MFEGKPVIGVMPLLDEERDKMCIRDSVAAVN